MRLSRAALAELGWEKGAASSSKESGLVDKSNAKRAPGAKRASGVLVIVGLDVALKGPFPLVGESEVSRTTPKFLCNRRHLNYTI